MVALSIPFDTIPGAFVGAPGAVVGAPVGFANCFVCESITLPALFYSCPGPGTFVGFAPPGVGGFAPVIFAIFP